jgi:hypothetical protein
MKTFQRKINLGSSKVLLWFHILPFSLFCKFKTQPAFCQVAATSFFPRINRPDCQSNDLLPYSTEAEDTWSPTSLPTSWYLIKLNEKFFFAFDGNVGTL